MTDLLDYMSWNIEHFSDKHMLKKFYTGVSVSAWVASLILEMEANMVGIMEATKNSGFGAISALVDDINKVFLSKNKKTGGWRSYFSLANIKKGAPNFAKSDCYAIAYDFNAVRLKNVDVPFGPVPFPDRYPLYWQTVSTDGKTLIDCLLWHAPQPKNNKGAKTMECIANLANAIVKKVGNLNFLISGDFNYNTGSSAAYKPLANLGFAGVFDGEGTTLTSLKSFMKDKENRQKMIAKGDYDEAFLASAYDNIFVHNLKFDNDLKVCIPYVILEEMSSSRGFSLKKVPSKDLQLAMQQAKVISDHMPLVVTITD